MHKIRRLTFSFVAVIQLCSFALGAEKRCVFSIEVVRDGGGLFPTGYTAVGDGIFLYEGADGQITGERHERLDSHTGDVREPQKEVFASGDAFTRRIRALFKKSAISEMDFPAAIAAAQRAMPEGKMFVIMGAKTVRVFADLEGTRFSFGYPGVGWALKTYADYDTKLRELKALLDGIAYEYGQSRIFIN